MSGGTEISYISGTKRPIARMGTVRYDLSGCGVLDSPRVGLFASAPDPTDPTSIPPTSYFDSSWSCADWITWHKANVAATDQATANAAFMKYWQMQGTFANDYNFCKYDSDFYDYFKSQGIDTGWWLSNLYVDASKVVTNTANAAASASSALTWIVPVAVVLVAGGALFWAKKEFLDKPKLGKRKYRS